MISLFNKTTFVFAVISIASFTNSCNTNNTIEHSDKQTIITPEINSSTVSIASGTLGRINGGPLVAML